MYVSELGGLPRELLLPTGPHDSESLRDAIEDILNNSTKSSAMGTYIVRRASSGTGGGTYRHFKISCSVGSFQIPDYSNASANSLSSVVPFPNGHQQEAYPSNAPRPYWLTRYNGPIRQPDPWHHRKRHLIPAHPILRRKDRHHGFNSLVHPRANDRG